MKKTTRLSLLAAAAILTACAPGSGPDKQPLRAQVVYKGQQCGPTPAAGKPPDAPQALWVSDAAGLKALGKRMANRRISGSPPAALSDLDFKAHGLLFVHMGQKPSSGYSLALVPEKTFITGRTAKVTLRWRRPAPDEMTAQVITQPCILIRLPRGNFSTIRVLDPEGRIKAVAGER